MGEDTSRFKLLRKASLQELFHLQNGLDITSVRELAIQLRNMDDETFTHHVHDDRNDFSRWVEHVFRDEMLAARIKDITNKHEMAKAIEEHLVGLEEEELERFGVHLPSNDLLSLEEYIEKQESKGNDEETVKEILLKKGWEQNIVSLVLTGRNNPYREYRALEHIENIDHFHTVLEQMKKHIIGAVSQGSTVDDIKEFLHKVGWHEDLVEFILYDIFQPHPNIKKLANFVIHKVKDDNQTIDEAKRDLLKLGWKEYIIDSVIYGIRQPDNSLGKILSYLDEFSDDNHNQIKTFLLQMGWNELDVNDAIRQKELEEVQQKLMSSFNLDVGEDIKEKTETVNEHLVRLFEHEHDLWKRLVSGYRKMDLSDFQQSNGELHLADEYTYYFSIEDLKTVKQLDDRKNVDVWFKDSTKPLLVEGKNRYLVLPKVIKRQCVVCGNVFPVTKMKNVEMWDDQRTHKVTKYVCLQHAKQIENFLEETKIVQS